MKYLQPPLVVNLLGPIYVSAKIILQLHPMVTSEKYDQTKYGNIR